MSQVSDVSLANQGFSAFRTELNNILGALNSMHSGTSRPSSATTGTMWLDTTNSGSNSLEIKFFDGSDDISVATIDTSANTINFLDSVVTGINIVTDTSPQLGGNLDVNGNDIVSTSNADVDLDPNGSGVVVFKGNSTKGAGQFKLNCETNAHAVTIKGPPHSASANYTLTLPNNDGDADQVLKTDGSGVLSFTSVSALSGSGIQNVVEDTTPQLGGDLDTNSANIKIDDAHGLFDENNNEQLIFQTTASAVNFAELTNASTGNDVGLAVDGGDTNVGLSLSTKGTGKFKFNDAAYFPEATLTDASTISWDVQSSPVAKVTLGASRTLGAATNGVAGQFVSLLVIQDGTGSRTLSFNAVYEFKDDTAPTLTATASKGDLFVFRYNGSKFLEVGRNLNLTLS